MASSLALDEHGFSEAALNPLAGSFTLYQARVFPDQGGEKRCRRIDEGALKMDAPITQVVERFNADYAAR